MEAKHRPDVDEIAALCAKIVERVERETGQRWNENAFLPATIGMILQGVLTRYGSKASALPDKLRTLPVAAPPETPAQAASILQGAIIAELEMAWMRTDRNDPLYFQSFDLRNVTASEEVKGGIRGGIDDAARNAKMRRALSRRD